MEKRHLLPQVIALLALPDPGSVQAIWSAVGSIVCRECLDRWSARERCRRRRGGAGGRFQARFAQAASVVAREAMTPAGAETRELSPPLICVSGLGIFVPHASAQRAAY
jgi:hypothetical protein